MARAIILIEDNPNGTIRLDVANNAEGDTPTPATELASWLASFVEDGTAAAPPKDNAGLRRHPGGKAP